MLPISDIKCANVRSDDRQAQAQEKNNTIYTLWIMHFAVRNKLQLH